VAARTRASTQARTQPLTGRVALVTGATQGIGRATAERLARDGAAVAVNGIAHDERMDEVLAATSGVAAPADVSDREAVGAMVAGIEQTVGTVDVLVVNHAYMTMARLVDHDPDDWWKVVDTNLGGAFHLVQAVLPGMLRAGFGRIVLISSEWGVTGWPQATAYAASKAGLISLTKTLGRELAPKGVIVNAVAPGVIDTPQLEVDAAAAGVTRSQIVEAYAHDIPMQRVGRPEEIAAAVALLVDPRMAALVGQVVQVNGGTTRTRA
jgi:NAD(P)-dependent dehydrogenase (short-subunit alcohol dehydrogenase family)